MTQHFLTYYRQQLQYLYYCNSDIFDAFTVKVYMLCWYDNGHCSRGVQSSTPRIAKPQRDHKQHAHCHPQLSMLMRSVTYVHCLSVCLSCPCSNFWKPWHNKLLLWSAGKLEICRSSSYIEVIDWRSRSLEQTKQDTWA